MNLLPARLEERAEGPVLRLADIELPVPRPAGAVSPTGAARVGIRPEHIRFCPDGRAGSIAGTITAVESLGREELVHVRSSGGRFSVLTTEKGLSVGATVHLGIDRHRVHLLGADEQGG